MSKPMPFQPKRADACVRLPRMNQPCSAPKTEYRETAVLARHAGLTSNKPGVRYVGPVRLPGAAFFPDHFLASGLGLTHHIQQWVGTTAQAHIFTDGVHCNRVVLFFAILVIKLMVRR